jgi:hypothetical protein
MSTLGDRIIEQGRLYGGDPNPFLNLGTTDLNELREELIRLRQNLGWCPPGHGCNCGTCISKAARR